ncbi:unnamed protein product, partial [Prorocentrum cordatum]
ALTARCHVCKASAVTLLFSLQDVSGPPPGSRTLASGHGPADPPWAPPSLGIDSEPRGAPGRPPGACAAPAGPGASPKRFTSRGLPAGEREAVAKVAACLA